MSALWVISMFHLMMILNPDFQFYYINNENAIDIEVAKALGELSQIPEPTENHYNSKIEKLLNMPLSKDMFKEHSLFLMKEHCKLFSPYSNKARELLDKLIQL